MADINKEVIDNDLREMAEHLQIMNKEMQVLYRKLYEIIKETEVLEDGN